MWLVETITILQMDYDGDRMDGYMEDVVTPARAELEYRAHLMNYVIQLMGESGGIIQREKRSRCSHMEPLILGGMTGISTVNSFLSIR